MRPICSVDVVEYETELSSDYNYIHKTSQNKWELLSFPTLTDRLNGGT